MYYLQIIAQCSKASNLDDGSLILSYLFCVYVILESVDSRDSMGTKYMTNNMPSGTKGIKEVPKQKVAKRPKCFSFFFKWASSKM